MAKAKRRPCPRGLYDGCPIPRERCTHDHEKTGEWHCLDFLEDFERFVFGGDDEGDEAGSSDGEVGSLEELLAALNRQEGHDLN